MEAQWRSGRDFVVVLASLNVPFFGGMMGHVDRHIIATLLMP